MNLSDKISNMYLNGKSTPRIASKLRIPIYKVSKILKENNIKIRKDYNRKYSIDEKFFDKINDEFKAYFLGILFADGYNNKKRNTIVLQLHEQDYEIVLKLNKLVQPSKPLQFIDRSSDKKFAHNAYRLVISSKHMCQKLEQLGCKNKKTFNLFFPDINKKLLKHFIRGVFDGDGSIHVNQPSHSIFSIIGYVPFIRSIQKILMLECKLNKTKINIDKRTHDIGSLIYCGTKQLKRIRKFLYEDSKIFMKRKFDKFMEIK